MSEWANRYYLKRAWPWWNVMCGTGTMPVFRALRWRTAARVEAVLHMAFSDGRYIEANGISAMDSGKPVKSL